MFHYHFLPIRIHTLKSSNNNKFNIQRVLALDLNTPPNQAMDFYFNTIESLKPGEKFKGPHTSCLAKTLRTDLKRIGKSFDTKEDLDQLRIIAKDKNEWIKMQNDIIYHFAF